MRRAVRLAVGLLVGTLASGCETFAPRMCDMSEQANPWLDYDAGTRTYETNSDGGAPLVLSYDSSPPNGEMLLYKGGMHYRIYHGLGRAPGNVQFAWSFDPYVPLDGSADSPDAGYLSPASGDSVIYDSDETMITVHNDSCADFYLRVTAQ